MSPRAALLLPLLLAAAAPSAAVGQGPFDACEERLADPASWERCECFYHRAIETGLFDEAAERLEARRRDAPDDPCLALALGRLRLASRDAAAAEPLLSQAAEGYAARGIADQEGYARINRVSALAALGASGVELTAELARAHRAAEASGDPKVAARVVVLEADLMANRGGDVGEIERSLRRAKEEVFGQAHASLRRDILFSLGGMLYARGRFREAEQEFQAAVEVTRDSQDRFGEARARHGLAASVGAQEPYSDPARRERVAELLADAVEAAAAAGNLFVEVDARKRLGRLLGGAAGREQIEIALKLIEPRAAQAPELLAGVLAASAVEMAEDDPAEARRRVDRAFAVLAQAPDPWSQVYGWADRLETLWRLGDRDGAIAAAGRTLEIAHRLEEIQSTETARAEVASVWTEIDQWLAGKLLAEAETAAEESPELVAAAFEASERMRARLLLGSLAEGGVGPAAAASAADRSAWLAVERGIVEAHQRLLDSTLTEDRRRGLLAELRDLEDLEDRMAARRRLLRAASIATPEGFVSLADLQADLAPDQALLAFQVGPWEGIDGTFGGGSWLLAVTPGEVRVRRLPERTEIADRVAILLGTVARRDGSEAELAAGLYEVLLGSFLDEMTGVERLVVVPDGPLHRLPFAALRRGPGEPTLAERFELFVTPSATVWRRLRETATPGRTTLALADPLLATRPAAGEETERSWTAGLVLPTLPHSRREGRSVLRHLGRPGRLLLGGEASEAAVKEQVGSGLCLLHLGTHAVLDERYPQRSAVFLSPGGADQDGLLRPREAADLDLRGAVVVLASCQSAQGTVLRGEGALSLARAFLEGGARAVVGSLWPVVDDEAADVFDRFYRHLGRGETVARALAQAQRESLEAGDPAAAWAGLVVLGDGDAVVVPEPRPAALRWLRSIRPTTWALLALALGLVTAALLAARARVADRTARPRTPGAARGRPRGGGRD